MILPVQETRVSLPALPLSLHARLSSLAVTAANESTSNWALLSQAAHEKRLAEQLVHKAESSRLAVRGVGATLSALTRGEAQTLLVEDGFEMPGFMCYDCHYPDLAEGACPHCHKALAPCPDVVDEAIELALRKNCEIEHVRGPTALREAGRMGALLRFHT